MPLQNKSKRRLAPDSPTSPSKRARTSSNSVPLTSSGTRQSQSQNQSGGTIVKRIKLVLSSPSAPTTQSSRPSDLADDEWQAECILKEGRKNYLVRWKGIDPNTGLQWEDTRIPKTYANQALVTDWKRWQTAHPNQTQRDPEADPPSPEVSQQAPRRPRRIIEDSSDIDRTQASQESVVPSIVPSSEASSPILLHAVSTQEHSQRPVVRIELGSSTTSQGDKEPREFGPDANLLVSSQSSSLENTGVDESEPSGPVITDRVIKDSQSLQESAKSASIGQLENQTFNENIEKATSQAQQYSNSPVFIHSISPDFGTQPPEETSVSLQSLPEIEETTENRLESIEEQSKKPATASPSPTSQVPAPLGGSLESTNTSGSLTADSRRQSQEEVSSIEQAGQQSLSIETSTQSRATDARIDQQESAQNPDSGKHSPHPDGDNRNRLSNRIDDDQDVVIATGEGAPFEISPTQSSRSPIIDQDLPSLYQTADIGTVGSGFASQLDPIQSTAVQFASQLESLHSSPSRQTPSHTRAGEPTLPARPQTASSSSSGKMSSSSTSYLERRQQRKREAAARIASERQSREASHKGEGTLAQQSPAQKEVADGPKDALASEVSKEKSPVASATEAPSEPPKEVRICDPIALSFSPSTRDFYRDLLRFKDNRALILALGQGSTNNTTIEQSQALVDELFDLTLHQDLTHNNPTQFDTERFVEWSNNCSSKFHFLDGLINASTDEHKHVALFIRPGRAVEILEQYLEASGINWACPERYSSSSNQSNLRITIVSTGAEGRPTVTDRADLIVGLDYTFSWTDPAVKQMSEDAVDVEKASPVVSLVVAYSVEHILRTISKDLNSRNKLKALLIGSDQLRSLAVNYRGENPAAIGQRVASLLNGTSDSPLTLPLLEHIHMPRSVASLAERLQGDKASPDQDNLSKRPRELEDVTEEPNKKSRVSLGEEHGGGSNNSITHISNSTGSGNGDTLAELKATQGRVRQAQAVIATQQTALAVLEPQHNSLVHENRRLTDEVKLMEKLRIRVATLAEENATLKAAAKISRGEIDTLNQRLLNEHVSVDVKELAEAKEQARRIEPLEKKLASAKQDVDYTRNLYQEASSAAAESADTIRSLREENERLTSKADGEQRRLVEQFQAVTAKGAKSQIERLKAQLAERERALGNVARELAAANEENKRLKDRAGAGLATRASTSRANSPLPAGHPAGASSRPAPVVGPVAPTVTNMNLLRAAAASVSRQQSRAGSRSTSRQASPKLGAGRAGGATPLHPSHLRE